MNRLKMLITLCFILVSHAACSSAINSSSHTQETELQSQAETTTETTTQTIETTETTTETTQTTESIQTETTQTATTQVETVPSQTATEASPAELNDFTGEWHRTNTDKAFGATITVQNQTDNSFDFSFFGNYGGHSGAIDGTAIITNENKAEFTCVSEYDENDYAKVEFSLDEYNLNVEVTDGNAMALMFGHNVYIDGEYTTSEPFYYNENIVEKILPNDSIKQKMLNLLGESVYEQMVLVFEYGVSYGDESLTYSGFISGAGQGVDLLIDEDKIYCLTYGLDSDGFVYKLYTNDKQYQNELPPFITIERPDSEYIIIYKEI